MYFENFLRDAAAANAGKSNTTDGTIKIEDQTDGNRSDTTDTILSSTQNENMIHSDSV